MGKSSRQRKHGEKMKRKRDMKAKRRALYASLAGTSRKAKKQRKASSVSGIYKHAHAMADCGNPGCRRCCPRELMHGAHGLGGAKLSPAVAGATKKSA